MGVDLGVDGAAAEAGSDRTQTLGRRRTVHRRREPHGLHGRAFPVACGVKFRRPDLHVFVVTGDGDC